MEKEKFISVMKRYELKYALNQEQMDYFVSQISKYMKPDKYGLTTIASLYFDSPDFRLINRSIEKPKYKEKLRLRSYGLASEDNKCFLEVKRKLDSIVYKRRILVDEEEAMKLINTRETDKKDQITRELETFINNYPDLAPRYLLIYDRIAYYQEDSDLRITLDMNPRYRTTDLNLHTSMEGEPVVLDAVAILEVKVQHSVPLWLVDILTKAKIYQTSFSKVGTAHTKEMRKKQQIKYKESIEPKLGGLEYGFTL